MAARALLGLTSSSASNKYANVTYGAPDGTHYLRRVLVGTNATQLAFHPSWAALNQIDGEDAIKKTRSTATGMFALLVIVPAAIGILWFLYMGCCSPTHSFRAIRERRR